MRRYLLLAWVGMVSSGVLAAPPKILFIGNSYTGYYDLPGTLARMAAPSEVPLDTAKCIAGGRTLERHWNEGKAPAMIKDGTKWDIVVLQVYVPFPSSENIEKMETYVRMFNKEIKAIGAKTIIYSHWGSYSATADDFWSIGKTLDAAVSALASDIGADVAHTGLLWIYADAARPSIRNTPPGLDLFGWAQGGDNAHPGPKGAYLNACYFYALVTGRSPVGLSRGGKNAKGNMSELLSPEEAMDLQKIAWEFYGKNHSQSAKMNPES